MITDTRSKIIQCAVELFEKKGYHGTTIQDIGDKAGVSKGAVFHYFQSKSDILYVIHEKFIDIILEQSDLVLRRVDINAAEKMRQLIINLVQLIADYKVYVVVFFEEYKYIDEENFKLIVAKRDQLERLYRAVLEQGIAGGEFRSDLDPDVVTKGMFGMCDWTYQWYRSNGKYTPEEIGMIFWQIFIGGLRAD